MNYLAHIYLSGDNDDIKIGNFIGDFVKGSTDKLREKYNEDIITGIRLHRFIDSYTDRHLLVQRSTARLHEVYHKYSGVVVDIFFDHFLAANWKNYSRVPLNRYTQNFYKLMLKNFTILPKKVKILLPYLIASNRLASYAYISGIERVLKIMENTTSLPPHSDVAIEILKAYYDQFFSDFVLFFSDIIAQVEHDFAIKIS